MVLPYALVQDGSLDFPQGKPPRYFFRFTQGYEDRLGQPLGAAINPLCVQEDFLDSF